MKVATVSLLLVAGARCCPDGWFQVAGSCYRSSPDRLTWYQAQEVGGTNTVAGLGNSISSTPDGRTAGPRVATWQS